jgi:hypothetical protein
MPCMTNSLEIAGYEGAKNADARFEDLPAATSAGSRSPDPFARSRAGHRVRRGVASQVGQRRHDAAEPVALDGEEALRQGRTKCVVPPAPSVSSRWLDSVLHSAVRVAVAALQRNVLAKGAIVVFSQTDSARAAAACTSGRSRSKLSGRRTVWKAVR